MCKYHSVVKENVMENNTKYSLTYLLMPSDKHNLTTARARDFISSLINVTSS